VKAEDPSGFNRTMTATSTSAVGGARTSGTDGLTSTVVTAEIPAVPANPNYGVLLPDGTIWYPGSQKRLPAPLLLRIAVWALAFLVIVAAAGSFIIHAHPSWVDPIRHVVSPTSPSSSNSGNHHPGGSLAGPKAALANPQPLGLPVDTTAYDVAGASSYVVVVKTGPNPCYVLAYTLVNGQVSGAPIFNGTLSGNVTQNIPATGPIDLEVAAAGSTISVWADFKQIGTVTSPVSVPWHFRFLTAPTS
jgi:hypothetical protein